MTAVAAIQQDRRPHRHELCAAALHGADAVRGDEVHRHARCCAPPRLGRERLDTFWRVYLPLSLHGVISGALIVYILSIGFFITPALMGGQHDIMIAMLIDRSVEITVDWPSAALMSLTLLLVTLVLYAAYYRVTDISRLMGAR